MVATYAGCGFLTETSAQLRAGDLVPPSKGGRMTRGCRGYNRGGEGSAPIVSPPTDGYVQVSASSGGQPPKAQAPARVLPREGFVGRRLCDKYHSSQQREMLDTCDRIVIGWLHALANGACASRGMLFRQLN